MQQRTISLVTLIAMQTPPIVWSTTTSLSSSASTTTTTSPSSTTTTATTTTTTTKSTTTTSTTTTTKMRVTTIRTTTRRTTKRATTTIRTTLKTKTKTTTATNKKKPTTTVTTTTAKPSTTLIAKTKKDQAPAYETDLSTIMIPVIETFTVKSETSLVALDTSDSSISVPPYFENDSILLMSATTVSPTMTSEIMSETSLESVLLTSDLARNIPSLKTTPISITKAISNKKFMSMKTDTSSIKTSQKSQNMQYILFSLLVLVILIILIVLRKLFLDYLRKQQLSSDEDDTTVLDKTNTNTYDSVKKNTIRLNNLSNVSSRSLSVLSKPYKETEPTSRKIETNIDPMLKDGF